MFASTYAYAQMANESIMRDAFLNWADKHNLPNAALTIFDGPEMSGAAAIGAHDPDIAAPIASLSKTITGLCVLNLAARGKLDLDAPIVETLPNFFSDIQPSDARAKNITVAHLLTHSSGITYDPTQGVDFRQFRPFNRSSSEQIAQAALSKDLGQIPGEKFHYNNANFSLVEIVIANTTGQNPNQFCSETILDPVGITSAKINPDWAVLGGFGGWQISTNDFAKLFTYFDAKTTLIELPFDKWPKIDLGGGAYYGPGVLMRENGNGYNFWHSGAFIWPEDDADFGAYYAYWGGKGFVTSFAPHVSFEAIIELDSSMIRAANQTPDN